MYSSSSVFLCFCWNIEHTFVVQTQLFNRLCKDQYITVVNGSLPGPTIYANEGDTIIVHLINDSPYICLFIGME
ncbi:hypothetical protein LIER_10072 [Lithospermum erythrorhizon]|uniref:Plastocyanin-like domain-containing protein n=1 Tax=Lithospermum erythrorhizon TaxID=34254 RepID=A0AAV3PMX6_LITER